MTLTCHYCGGEFERPTSKGRVPRYCRPSHRQRAYEQRRWERVDEVLAENNYECRLCDTTLKRGGTVFIPNGEGWDVYCHPCNLEMVNG